MAQAGSVGLASAVPSTCEKLVLKELRLANEGTVAAQTAFHASCGTACRTISSTTSGGSIAGRHGSNSGGSSSGGGQGGGGGRWKKKGRGGSQSRGGHRPPALPAAPWYCYPPWTAGVHQQPWRPPAWGGPGVLGAFPSAQAHTVLAPAQFSGTATSAPPPQQQGGWDQAGLIAALNQMSLQGSSPWVLDTGATTHMSSSDGILLSRLPPPPSVRNLLSVRQFTHDNNCSIEFDACGFSVKDQQTGRVTLCCNSGGDLYTFPSTLAHHCSLATTLSLWHQRLGHPGPSSLANLQSMSVISYNKSSPCLCHACQLGKHPGCVAGAPGLGHPLAGPPGYPAGGHLAAAPPAGGPQLGGWRFGVVYTRRARSAVPTTEAVAPEAASVAPVVPPAAPPPPSAPPAASPSALVARPVTRSQTGSDFSQEAGVDYDETFSPVVKPATIRTVLSIAASRDWPIRQLDVKNAFLHGNLEETVYREQPKGFVDPAAPNSVCLLQKSLYGLKQAPRAWNQRFSTYICSIGFTTSKSDASLFIYKDSDNMVYLLLYVDDIIVTASSTTLLQHVTSRLHSEFAMTDLGDLHHFLGISVTRDSSGLFLSQRQYAVDLLQRAGMSECHLTATPVDVRTKLSASEGA
ncbi:uncharacterized protein [Miscanthus floridulus]|uniref:uncharacterized protein n=1 Tax=Miscanthus floridulus TaxID=154761 RepID=UPI0034577CE5